MVKPDKVDRNQKILKLYLYFIHVAFKEIFLGLSLQVAQFREKVKKKKKKEKKGHNGNL